MGTKCPYHNGQVTSVVSNDPCSYVFIMHRKACSKSSKLCFRHPVPSNYTGVCIISCTTSLQLVCDISQNKLSVIFSNPYSNIHVNQ